MKATPPSQPDTAIYALAKYFTENVAHHSMCLQLTSLPPHLKAATAFFEARKALGIEGYIDHNEAAKIIRKNIFKMKF